MRPDHDDRAGYSSPLETYWVARFDYRPDEDLRPHQHPFYQLLSVIGGEATGHLDEMEFPLRRGSVMLARPGQTHGLHSSQADPLRTLDTKFAVRDPELRSELDRIARPLCDESDVVRSLMEELREEGERGGRWRRICCDSLLARIAVILIRMDHDTSPEPVGDPLSRSVESQSIQQAIRYIEDHYMEEISTDDIAAVAGFSRQHLAKKFQEECAVSPHEYLLHYRIHRAKELLRHTHRPIKAITGDVGFRSIHHFTRAFHSVAGIPPGRWREEEVSSICKDINVAPEFVNIYILLPSQPGGLPEIRVARNQKSKRRNREAMSRAGRRSAGNGPDHRNSSRPESKED
jgi:AraC-like DNA-binding protein/quercetin dioxygenase-like cupin family protein